MDWSERIGVLAKACPSSESEASEANWIFGSGSETPGIPHASAVRRAAQRELVTGEIALGRECLGPSGRNGADKADLLEMLNGVTKANKGRVEIGVHMGALPGASFNPDVF